MDGDDATRPSALHLAALFGLSATVLAFEVLLLRLFEFSHWHHFAGLAISLALLGLGVAGTVLALLGPRRAVMGDGWFLGGLACAAAGLLLVLALHTGVAVRPILAGWDAGELGRLLLVDLVAFLPFLGAGLAIGQVFMRWPRRTRRLYAVNLLGSGAGSVAATVLLAFAQVETAVAAVAALLALLGTAVALARRHRLAAAGCGLAALAAVAAVAWPPTPAVSDFKALARLQALPGARVLDVRPGLPGRLTLVRADSLRFAPGLSLGWDEPVPAADAAVIGSDRVIPVARSHPAPAAHQAASLGGLPGLLRPRARVLALGSGSWPDGAAGTAVAVTRVEPDARLFGIARARGAGHRLVEDAPWRYLAATDRRYDVITLRGAYEGGDAASEDYLMTVRGLRQALARLAPDGLLALPLELQYPPRRFPRALATLRAALERHGAAAPGRHVAVLRSLQAVLVLASPRPLAAADVAAVREFAARWSFDLAWLPGLARDAANRRHRLASPAFFDAARAVLADGSLSADARRFVTAPATMARPYFWRSMRWAEAPGLLRNLGPRALSYLDWTLLLAALTTALVVVLAFVLILLPLGRLPAAVAPFGRASVAAYFGALGAGYLLLELALFQRAILFLGEPVVAAAVVFALFLLGSGVGSAMAPVTLDRRRALPVFGAIAAGLAIAAAGLWALTGPLVAAPFGVRVALVGGLLAPLAWALGRPFPWILRQLWARPRWVPWAWGINGFTSVAAAAAAPLVSIHLGQPVTLAAGAGCYALALAVAWRWTRGVYAGGP